MNTTDIWFASFLILEHGKDVIAYERISDRRGRYRFDISKEDWDRYKLEFNKSDTSKLKYIQEQLKDLLH